MTRKCEAGEIAGNVPVVSLLWNEKGSCHKDKILDLLKHASSMDCMVAFAKESVLYELMDPLKSALKRGMKARFAIGLNFHLTEPSALRKLLDLSRTYDLDLYLANGQETFHPKIYAFRSTDRCALIVGSANLTSGGLKVNHEASTLVEDKDGELVAGVKERFDDLISTGVLLPATDDWISRYEGEYQFNAACLRVVASRIKVRRRVLVEPDISLSEILVIMKKGQSRYAWAEQVPSRRKMRDQALKDLEWLARTPENDPSDFYHRYERLIASFHSAGLKRAKGWIAKDSDKFIKAVSDILRDWKGISRAKEGLNKSPI